MTETAVLMERVNTHIDDSNKRHEQHEVRIKPLEDFVSEMKIDIKWIQKIGLGILAIVASPYAVELFKYLLKK